MRRLTILMAFLLIVCSQLLNAQGVQIKGKVTSSEDGSALPGASVVVKGTNIATITDADGNYLLNAPQGAAIIWVSFVGMKTQEIKIEGQTTVNVVLQPDVTGLQEVVITALGISREKKALGYSVQDVKSDEINRTVNSNVVNTISGKIAGVQVTNSTGVAGASSYITIRGMNSITGENQPLFVVDGVPIDNSQNYSGDPNNGINNGTNGVAYSNRAMDLNPEDIESISVLKGGAASALYGLRAANGAIIITSKKGSNTGGLKNGNVTFSSSISIDEVSNLPGLQMSYGQGDAGGRLGPESGVLNKRLSWGPLLDTMRFDGSKTYKWDPNGMLVGMHDPTATSKKAIAYNNPDLFFKTGYTYNNNFSISGGNDVSNVYASYANMKTEGIVPNNEYIKNNLKLSAQTKVSKRLTISGDASYINSSSTRLQQGSNVSGVMLGLYRTPPTFNNAAGYEFTNGTQRTFRGGGGYDNPFWSVNKEQYKDNVNRLIGDASLNYKFTDWMNLNYKIGTDFYSDDRKQFFDIHSAAYLPGMIFLDNQFNRDLNSDLILSIKHNIVQDLDLSLILGHNMYQQYYQQIYVQGSTMTIPGFYDISNTSSIIARNIVQEKRTAALYGDLGLSYKNMLFYDGTLREEWSTTLPSGNNHFPYWSSSLGFIFTELSGLKDNEILSYGKLRASYAKIANDAPVYYTSTPFDQGFYNNPSTSGISFPFMGTSGFQVGDILGNSKLGPENLQSTEVGAELKFLKNRIGIDFAYYYNHNSDLILQTPVSGASGYISKNMNAAVMENKGVELVVNLVPVKLKTFEWDMTVNFTKNKNMVVDLAPGVSNVELAGFTGTDVRAVKGYSYGTVFGQDVLKDTKGNTIIDDQKNNSDGSVNQNYGYPVFDAASNPIALGSSLPDWTMGITNSFKAYGCELSFLIDIKHGGKIWDGTRGILNYFGTGIDTKNRDQNNVFTGVPGHIQTDKNGNNVVDANGNDVTVISGTKNSVNAPLNEYWYSNTGGGFGGPASLYMEDASWVRLRELSLSYTLDNKIIEKTKFIKSFSIYFSGKNLWLKTPYKGVDPETSLFGANSAQGVDYFNMPATKTYTFGIKAMF